MPRGKPDPRTVRVSRLLAQAKTLMMKEALVNHGRDHDRRASLCDAAIGAIDRGLSAVLQVDIFDEQHQTSDSVVAVAS